ncbi:MAG: amylo-alpha-1,6-glucosidase [Halobacteriota archaeon]|nr:amylo-alpha-1,6-glucosidase [Halobacteriota archaeon]
MRFDLEIDPIEDRDPSITKHLILKRRQASWSQSVFSVPLFDKIVPNRDYPYEGLSLVVRGENYHILDAIAIGLKEGGRDILLKPSKVIAYPWKMVYLYEGRVPVKVEYYLLDTDSAGIAAHILIETYAKNASVVLEPIIDIRHMYEDSEPLAHWCKVTDRGMMIGRDDITLLIETPKSSFVKRGQRQLSWWYKLGSGYREYVDGDVVFKGENKNLVSMGELIIPESKLTSIGLACGTSREELDMLIKKAVNGYRKNERKEEKRARRVVEALNLDGDAAFRAITLTKFGMNTEGHSFHEAGDFWFRSVWFRDEFEGLLNNINTFFLMGFERGIKDILLSAFEYQDEFGRIPNRISKPVDYNSADATLLAFVLGGEYIKRTGDLDLARSLLRKANRALSSFERGDLEMINGPPVLHENGLISVVSWHSWTDAKRAVEEDGKTILLPIRIPEDWKEAGEEQNKPKYLLPEINAQWILMLRSLVSMANLLGEGSGRYYDILSKASKNFRQTFLNDGFLYNVVHTDGRCDPTLGSPALVAIDLLENLFSEEDMKKFVRTIKEGLLMRRGDQPFGVLIKGSEKRVYFGDNEYHEGVVWPRDTPYLIRVLLKCGEEEIVEDILKSNLDHQMNEGFVFYNSELFSPDNGHMTPVKNPIQWWSQWVDPFFELKKGGIFQY